MIKKTKELLYKIELYADDLVLMMISAMTLIVFLAALYVVVGTNQEAVAQVSENVQHIYMIAWVLLPWIVMLGVFWISRELWQISRTLSRIHIEAYLSNLNTARKSEEEQKKKIYYSGDELKASKVNISKKQKK